jgi:hypothetical protein
MGGIMENPDNRRAGLREKAKGLLKGLAPSEREALLVKCWMSHDARWFMVVAKAYGIKAANRLNQMAAHEVGKVEALRIARKLNLQQFKSLDDILLAQEVLIGLLGPDLIDYRVLKAGESAYQVHVERCFAHENVIEAGISDHYQCGIFARVTGWFEALDLDYGIKPSLGKCLKVKGEECLYTFSFK